MSEPTPQALTVENATLRRQLQSAETSILHMVQALELLNRSVHEFEATHPATISAQIQELLQQIRTSHPGPLPAPIPEPPPRRRIRPRKHRPQAAA
jgi:hypothetical protein